MVQVNNPRFRRLYPRKIDVGKVWGGFPFLHPDLAVLQDGKEAINPLTYLKRVGDTFFPKGISEQQLGEAFIQATNRGTRTLNYLVEEHCAAISPTLVEELKIKPLEKSVTLSELIDLARKQYRDSRSIALTRESNIRQAYEAVRNLEMGYRVLMIDTEPAVLSSLRHYQTLMQWFNEFLEIGEAIPQDRETFTHSFPTTLGVSLYGFAQIPFRSRIKYLTSQGEVKYGSLLMKHYLAALENGPKARHEPIRDQTAIELILGTDQDVEEVVEYFRESRPTGRLEKFKQRERGKTVEDNQHASGAFGLTKFIYRPPVAVEEIADHPLGKLLCERHPVEVQLLTLEDHHIRQAHPEANHQAYKQRQFFQLFAVLFPRKIYAPFIDLS